MKNDKTNSEARGLGPLLKSAATAAWPICLGYLPLGLAMGVLGQKAGIAPWLVGFMSLCMFSGTQIIAVAMLGAGASLAAITATIFMLNLRYALMSSALAVHLHGARRGFLALFAAGITDETFVVNTARFQAGGWSRMQALAMSHTTFAAWIAATLAGSALGEFIPPGAFGIDYTIHAMFLCLLVLQMQNRLLAVTAVLSMVIAVLWSLLIPGNSHIIGGAVCGATLGFFIKRRRNAR